MTALVLDNTPLEDHRANLGLLVKREDLCCPPPGPPFSKVRGVVAHVRARYEAGVRLFGVLDTSHSQAGHAVALACREVGAGCWNFFPVRKGEEQNATRPQQVAASKLGARLYALKAGRSAILYHQAKKVTEGDGDGYMMPNALKLPETVEETAAEVRRTLEGASDDHRDALLNLPWLISASSGTIASGLLRGLSDAGAWPHPLIVHLGYDRPYTAVMEYLAARSGLSLDDVRRMVQLVNQGYSYADQAKMVGTQGVQVPMPPWPCNPWYDLKAYQWWMTDGRRGLGQAVMWNVG